MKKTIVSLLIVIFTFNNMVFASNINMDNTKHEYTNAVAEKLLEDSEEYDASVFGDDHAYLMQDSFLGDGMYATNSWDTDFRGGSYAAKEGFGFEIQDSDETELCSMTKHFMAVKSGKVTFETAFKIKETTKNGFFYELTGNGKRLFKFITNGDMLYLEGKDKKQPLDNYKGDERISVKAIIDLDKNIAEISINGKKLGEFKTCDQVEMFDCVTISTSKEEEMNVSIEFVYIYINYIINEKFLTGEEGSTPDDWELVTDTSGSGIFTDKNQSFPDIYSFLLKDSSAVDSVMLKKQFDTLNENFVFENFLIVDKVCDGVQLSLGNDKQNIINIETDNGNLMLNQKHILIENYKENFWYHIKVEVNTENNTADYYINYKKVMENIPYSAGYFSNITYQTPIKRQVELRVDDITLYKDVPLPDDYVPEPEPVEIKEGLHPGMLHYSMWNEGNHYGWDYISSYKDRMPYLGFYSERSSELWDWTIKFQVEHGLEFMIHNFCRGNMNVNEPVKLPKREQALYDGYFNAEYSNYEKFAILYSNISSSTVYGYDDFTQNIVPYFMEYYFKDPRYFILDNRPVLYVYDSTSFVNAMGGLDEANRAIDFLDNYCKSEGFDGVYFLPSITTYDITSNLGQGSGYQYTMQFESRNAQSQEKWNNTVFERLKLPTGTVGMGWGRGAWQDDYTIAVSMTPEDITEITNYLIDKFNECENIGKDHLKIITYTSWDEYGEGHYFAPTYKYGFEYLNAIRNATTDSGEREFEELPSAKAIARMGSLYEQGRRDLQYFRHGEEYVELGGDVDKERLQVLASWDFEGSNSLLNWKIDKHIENLRIENGALTADITDWDPGIILDGANIDADMVKAVRITCRNDGGGMARVFYQTDVDPQMGVNGKSFDIVQEDGNMHTYMAYPKDKSKLEGTITSVRFDPADRCNEFEVKKIEILGYEETAEEKARFQEELFRKNNPYKIFNSGTEVITVVRPQIINGCMYAPINRMMEQFSAKTLWNYNSQSYTIERDGKVMILHAGSETAELNGGIINLQNNVYYDDGNLYVPIRAVFEAMGATVDWLPESNGVNIAFPAKDDGYNYLAKRDDKKPMSFMFETSSDFEGWTKVNAISTMNLKRGALTLSVNGAESQILLSGITTSASKYPYMRLRVKNETNASTLRVLFTTSTDSKLGGEKKLMQPITTKDSEYKEYTVDLSKCAAYSGMITSFRLDFLGSQDNSGKIRIDEIEFFE